MSHEEMETLLSKFLQVFRESSLYSEVKLSR